MRVKNFLFKNLLKILKLILKAPPYLYSRSNEYRSLMYLLKHYNFCMKHFFL